MTKYIVALQVGGVMEQPHFTYEKHQTIEANSEAEAEQIYNKLNNCSYYYGHVVGKDGVITIHDEPIKHNSVC